MNKLLVLVVVINVLLLLIVGLGNAAPTEEETSTTTQSPKKCQDMCELDNNIVCGYDGTCYREYPNKCSYSMEKCTKRKNLETVDISLCELAAKDNHPNFKICNK